MRSGLVKKTVQVRGKGGKTYERTYWVRSGAPAPHAAEHGPGDHPALPAWAAHYSPAAKAAILSSMGHGAAAGASPPRPAPPATAPAPPARSPSPPAGSHDPRLVHEFTDRWAHDNHAAGGLAMSMVASRVYGTDFAPTEARMRTRHANSSWNTPDERMANARRIAAHPQAEASFREMARQAQAAHPPDADGMVTLYRGVGNSRANADGTHTFGTDALTSFTTSRGVAQAFASMHGGHVVAVRVPHSSIVASHKTNRGLRAKREAEVVVASRGSFTGRVVSPGARR